MPRLTFAIVLTLSLSCKSDEKPAGAKPSDARPARGIDARAPSLDAAAPAPIDAAAAVATDAGAPTGAPCRRSSFETTMVADACAEGGQAAAKAAMKKFLRDAKKQEPTLDCKGCHDKLAPDYSLKKDGLEHFEKLGGT